MRKKIQQNFHILVILNICLKQMLGNKNIFHTITLLASSCSSGVCDWIEKELRNIHISYLKVL